MSTGLECCFIEPEAGRWYYVLQSPFCPVGAFDWREDAECYGPFPSMERAETHLRRHHANPGGYSVSDQETFRMDPTWQRLIAGARN